MNLEGWCPVCVVGRVRYESEAHVLRCDFCEAVWWLPKHRRVTV
jgi:hypothetical protein